MSAPPDYIQDADRGFSIVPAAASEGATHVDLLALALFLVSVLMILIVIALVIYFGIRYREGAVRPRRPLLSEGKTLVIETSGAVGLLALFLVFFGWGAQVYTNLYQGPEDALTIQVVGKQWMWKLQHPDGTREINTLHLPANRDIRLNVTSQDVIHSVYIPAFRIKRDAVPGTHRSVWFHTTEPGEYRLFCAEYCGTDHSRMRGKVVVMPPADYESWLSRRGTASSPARIGKRLFSTYGCAGCHLGKASVRAPNLDGIYGRPIPLTSGETTLADEAYLRDSILQPSKDIVAGYAAIMPSFSNRIGEGDLQRLVAYIKSLDPGDWEQGP